MRPRCPSQPGGPSGGRRATPGTGATSVPEPAVCVAVQERWPSCGLLSITPFLGDLETSYPAPPGRPPRLDGMTAAEFACIDGRILPSAEASIPVTDDGLLRGDGVFEVIRVYHGRPFALAEHLDRIERSAANLRLDYEVPRSELESEIPALVERRGGDSFDGQIRVVLTRG